MRQDPFERMQRSNPVPPDQTPSTPMGTADRIIGSRVSWPGWVVAVAAAAAVVVIGGGTLTLMNRPDATPVAVSSTAVESTTSSAPVVSTTQPTVTTTSPSVAPPPVVTLIHVEAGVAIVYFIIDNSTATGSSQALIPVARSLATISAEITDLPSMAVAFLIAGPTAAEFESIPAFTTAIPDGTRLLGLTVAEGVATIDLSEEFAVGGGSFAEIARIDQVVYTLTRFEEIDGVRFQIEGVPIDIFGSHGLMLDDPVVRTEFDVLLPAILIETPPYPDSGDPVLSGLDVGNYPLVASGTANVFEAVVSMALTDADGLIIWEGYTMASCGTGCRGEWSISIPYEVGVAQTGSLIVWEGSAYDGSRLNVREHPVWLLPAISEATSTGSGTDVGECSGLLVTDQLVEQPGLPAEVASMRAEIFGAAVTCDWTRLRSLQEGGFAYSFGINDDAIAYWQDLEAAGEQPIRFLAELLNRPYGTQPGSTAEYYDWPSAFVTEWSLVPDADREALRPLYDDEDFAVFAEFGGYFGYRVGIIDGAWVYFVAGD